MHAIAVRFLQNGVGENFEVTLIAQHRETFRLEPAARAASRTAREQGHDRFIACARAWREQIERGKFDLGVGGVGADAMVELVGVLGRQHAPGAQQKAPGRGDVIVHQLHGDEIVPLLMAVEIKLDQFAGEALDPVAHRALAGGREFVSVELIAADDIKSARACCRQQQQAEVEHERAQHAKP